VAVGVYYADGNRSRHALVKADMARSGRGRGVRGPPPPGPRRALARPPRSRGGEGLGPRRRLGPRGRLGLAFLLWKASTSATASSGSIRLAALPIEERAAGRNAFARSWDWPGGWTSLRAYTLTGVRADSDSSSGRSRALRDLGELSLRWAERQPLAGWLETPTPIRDHEASGTRRPRRARKVPQRLALPRRLPL